MTHLLNRLDYFIAYLFSTSLNFLLKYTRKMPYH